MTDRAEADINWAEMRPQIIKMALELVKLSRLSVSKVRPQEWALLCQMGGRQG